MQNAKELKTYIFIHKFYKQNGYSPSIQTITNYLGLKSRSYVFKILNNLKSKGYLINIDGKYIPLNDYKNQVNIKMVPILGQIAAGQPILAIENFDGYIGYIPHSSSDDKELFALRIKGNSMIGAGIFNGDIVIIEQTSCAENGEIVAAMIDGEATVKTFYKENGRFRLQPQNPTMNPIIVDNVTILGKVVSSMRYY